LAFTLFGRKRSVRDLGLHALRQEAVGAAHDHVRRDADGPKLLDGVLHGLRLQLSGGGNERHQGDVDVADVLAADVGPDLADGFQEGQRLDVAHRAPNLGDQHVHLVGGLVDARLDLVGHVRNHLDGAAEVVAAPLLREDGVVDLARGRVVDATHPGVAEALVVTQVEVGLGPVLGHVDLTVLERVHGSGVDVQVGVELEEGDAQAARFEQRADGRRSQAFAQRGEHPAGHEDVLGGPRRHAPPFSVPRARVPNDTPPAARRSGECTRLSGTPSRPWVV
jgi:hypothetical protein